MKLEEKEKKIENKFSWEKRENLFGGQRWNWMDSLYFIDVYTTI
jgi:hypothetical protein